MGKKSRRGEIPELNEEEINWILDGSPKNKCFGCDVDISKEGYKFGERKNLIKLRDSKKEDKIILWTCALKIPTKNGGKRTDIYNFEKVCLSCLGDEATVYKKVGLPQWLWNKMDLIVDKYEVPAAYDEPKITRSRLYANTIISSGIKEPVKSAPLKIPPQQFEFKIKEEQAEYFAKKHLGELLVKDHILTNNYKLILNDMQKLLVIMEENKRNLENILPKSMNGIFEDIHKKTLHDASYKKIMKIKDILDTDFFDNPSKYEINGFNHEYMDDDELL